MRQRSATPSPTTCPSMNSSPSPVGGAPVLDSFIATASFRLPGSPNDYYWGGAYGESTTHKAKDLFAAWAAHAAVGIGDGLRAHVHHAARLEGIEIEMVKNTVEGVGAVVDVGQFLRAVVLVFGSIDVDVHHIVDALLPAFWLCVNECRPGCNEDGYSRK